MTKFEKIFLVINSFLILAAVFLGVVVFGQQKDISNLKSAKLVNSLQSALPDLGAKGGASSTDFLQGSVKQFIGKTESVSGNQLVVTAKLADFSKPKDPVKLKNSDMSTNLSTDDFEVLEKKITVIANENTKWGAKGLADLKAGDVINVWSDKSPYESDKVTALNIFTIGQ